MKASRTKRSPPEPCLPSPRHNSPTAPSHRASGFPMQSGLLSSFGKSPVFVSGTHAAGCVSVR
eukprot:34443-Prorocentrum_minimum.AAC.1